METKQIVQASANVIRITKLTKGSIYKRFDKDYENRTYYGIVKNVYNDGVNAIIEATEYRYGYSSLEAEHKVLTGQKDYILFPATLEELQLEFSSVVSSKEREIKESLEKIERAKKMIVETESLISGEMQKNLQMADFKEMTQGEYNQRIKELN